MALAFAIEYYVMLNEPAETALLKSHVEFLSAGTDGQDGPTDATGAVVNRDTVSLAMAAKLVRKEYLDNNDYNTFFKLLNDTDNPVSPGLTCTNVMDIQLMLIKLK